MRFDIQPYVGALPITFGMSREEVHDLLGSPEASFLNWDNRGMSEHYNEARYNVGYSNDGRVDHIGFCPGGCKLFIQGREIWTEVGQQPDPNLIFLTLDSEPLEFVGFWYFLRLGVTTTGYHDDDPGQRAVTVFPQGAKASFLAEAKPADASKYRQR